MRGFFDFTLETSEDKLVFDGGIYNFEELKRELTGRGIFIVKGDVPEICLKGYREYGEDFFKKINGTFALALWDGKERKAILCRDKIGVKPLYYTLFKNKIFFGSTIQDVLENSGIEAVVTTEGLCEIFALGPAKSRTADIFQGISEVIPAQYVVFQEGKLQKRIYWKLESFKHKDSFPETVEKTAWLLKDAVKRQMQANTPVSTFLSGGIDSSLVTAICAKELKRQGQQLDTFSFDFEGNRKYFKANAFQPSQDRPWVEKMVQYADTKHRYLECDNDDLVAYLYKAVDAADLPCMADVEGSMLYFCEQTAKERKVVLTGEGADEIFGGYPWFYKEESFAMRAFPWSFDMKPRQTLLADTWIERLPMEEYAREAYEKTIEDTPALEGDHRSVLFSVKHRLKGCRHIDLLVKFRMPSRQPSLYLKSFPFQLVHQKQRGIELFPAYLLKFPDPSGYFVKLLSASVNGFHHPCFLWAHSVSSFYLLSFLAPFSFSSVFYHTDPPLKNRQLSL